MSKVIIDKLEDNLDVFRSMLQGLSQAEKLFRPHAKHWCLLEIICHLLDEEKFDFRVRVFHTLSSPEVPPPPFNPLEWVSEHDYMGQDFDKVLSAFIDERQRSIKKLRSLENPNWQSGYTHKTEGRLTANHYLNNWLAHDFLHLRQITKVKYEYLKSSTPEINFNYAGKWVL